MLVAGIKIMDEPGLKIKELQVILFATLIGPHRIWIYVARIVSTI
jgi:hypothetical protein